jgi:LL-diaminopimelate aminotransferase
VAAYALGPAGDALLADVLSVYPPRRQRIVTALEAAGFEVFGGGATFYVWARTPNGETAMEFCRRALAEQALVVTPGTGFGPGGEGWFRISLTAADDRVDAAAERLGRL